MRETQAIIERVRRVSSDLQQLDLAVDPALTQLQPGQGVLAHLVENTGWHPYLRQHWIPINRQGTTLTVEIAPSRTYAPGQVVSLLSPVGRAIPARANRRHLLLIAEDALPTPLVLLARVALAAGAEVTLVLRGAALRYPLELLPPEVEILHADTDWKWPDQVETLGWADQVVALAPPLAQSAVYGRLYDTISQLRHHAVPDQYVCGLYYQQYACGVGACQACQIAGSKGDLLACTDGPAVDLKQVKFA